MSGSAAAVLLEGLARASDRLRALAIELRDHPEVERVDRQCDIEHASTGPSIEWYVDAELVGGIAISWRLQALFDAPQWLLSADVRSVHALGSDFVTEFESRKAGDTELGYELTRLADELAAVELPSS